MDEKSLRIWISAFALILIGMAVGYFWCYKALADYEYQPPLSYYLTSPAVKKAMQRMGPLHDYIMVGEKLYVDAGNGVWQRLRYR